MSKYFRYFPTTPHDLTNIGQQVQLTNILRRFTIDPSVKNNIGVYYDYNIQSHDRPDTIAKKYYGDSGYAWVVLMFNEIHDPIFGWPLFGYDFEQYIRGKYGSIRTAQQTAHEYRKILNASSLSWNEELAVNENGRKYDGTIIPKRYVVVDQTTFTTLGEREREYVTKWDWELEENERKRAIKILDKRYLNLIKDEVKNIVRTGV